MNSYKGVGLNLRLEFIDQVLEQKPKIPFFEIIADNWLSNGVHHKKLEKIRESYPISFHCVGLNIGGMDKLNHDYLKSIKKLINIYRPFQVSDHLCFQNHEGHYFHDLLPIPFNDKALIHTADRIHKIQDTLKQNILIENLSYYIEYKDSHLSEIQFINSLIGKTGCHFLLDLNNIWVNGLNLAHKTDNFLDQVNWNHVKEIHIAGPEKMDDIFLDTHGSFVHKDVLMMVKKYKAKINGLPLIYERDNNIPPLRDLLDEISIIKRHLI